MNSLMARCGISSSIALIALLFAADGRGDCLASRPFITPVSGTKLPPNPVLYVFTRSHDNAPQASVESADPNAGVKVELVSGNDTFEAYKLSVKQEVEGALKIVVDFKSSHETGTASIAPNYVIDRAWKRPGDKSVRIDSLTKEMRSWQCSHNQTYNLRPSVSAMAYRVEWATTPTDFAAGNRESGVFPYSLEPFFQPQGGPFEAVIKLGHANCLSNTFRWPAAIVYVGLVALHPDGSETPNNEVPAAVPWSFGHYLFGAQTDEFYKKVRGYPKPGSAEARDVVEEKRSTSKPLYTATTEGSGGGAGAHSTRGCDQVGVGAMDPWGAALLLVGLLVLVTRAERTSDF